MVIGCPADSICRAVSANDDMDVSNCPGFRAKYAMAPIVTRAMGPNHPMR